jgi:hypothetical protein
MTRRTAFNGSASGRRRERRAALQSKVAASSEVLHRPTLSRSQILLTNGRAVPKRIEDAVPLQFLVQDAFWQRDEYKRNIERFAVIYANEFNHRSLDMQGTCLPDVALYAAGHRNTKQVTAR